MGLVGSGAERLGARAEVVMDGGGGLVVDDGEMVSRDMVVGRG